MFNADQKIKFLQHSFSSISSYNSAEYLFNEVEPFEEKLNKDICTMSETELHPILSELMSLRRNSQQRKLAMLIRYCNWCVAQNIPNAVNNVISFSDDANDKLRDMMVGDPAELNLYLDIMFPSGDGDRIDCIYRCYCWMAFMGIDEKDILSIKISDVDLDNFTVNYKDLILPIYREAFSCFRQAVKATQFSTYHPNYPDKPVIRQRISGDELIRGVKATPDINTFRSTITHRNKAANKRGETNKKLSFKRIRLSGLFYETLMLERRGISPDFRAVAELDIVDKNYTGRSYTENRLRLTKSYAEDYDRWKLVFWNI